MGGRKRVLVEQIKEVVDCTAIFAGGSKVGGQCLATSIAYDSPCVVDPRRFGFAGKSTELTDNQRVLK